MKFLFVLLLASCASAHDYYTGSCPNFPPMPGFDWNEVRTVIPSTSMLIFYSIFECPGAYMCFPQKSTCT